MPELIVPIRQRGAVVPFLVRPASRGGAYRKPLTAYLDTGASASMLDVGVIGRLGVEPVRTTALNVLGREEVFFHDLYEVEVGLVLPAAPPYWVPLTILGGAVFPTGAVAALGRDFLRRFVFTYDGPRERVTLRW